VATKEKEEVRIAVEEFSGQRSVRRPTYGVISTADAQHRHSRLIHIPEGVIVVPVGIPADGETLGVTEEGLLKLSQGASCGIPDSNVTLIRYLLQVGQVSYRVLGGRGNSKCKV
uniref:Uncharacterized protein n=1 Tax=Castor canadensis TaxID=51338 RepID=A0A8C0ZYJ1_CASCN